MNVKPGLLISRRDDTSSDKCSEYGSHQVNGGSHRQTKRFLPLLPSTRREGRQDQFPAYSILVLVWRNHLDCCIPEIGVQALWVADGSRPGLPHFFLDSAWPQSALSLVSVEVMNCKSSVCILAQTQSKSVQHSVTRPRNRQVTSRRFPPGSSWRSILHRRDNGPQPIRINPGFIQVGVLSLSLSLFVLASGHVLPY